MDRVRYVLAVIGLVSIPPAVLYWFIIHPFVDVWRRVGKPTTYTMLFVVFVACGYALWLARGPLLAVDYGTNPWLWAPGLAFYLGAVAIQTKIRRQLTFKVLAGVPELDASGKGGVLLDTGLYARVRHPRYLAVTLGQIAWAFFTNYLAMYALIPIIALGLAAVAWFEERELEARFGQAYAEYRRRVPMIIPRLRSARQ